MINKEDVSRIRKGIDCNDFDVAEVNKYFYKNAQESLEILKETFNNSLYFCPKCEKQLSDASVLCEKCACWYYLKCAKNVGPEKWYCDKKMCKTFFDLINTN